MDSEQDTVGFCGYGNESDLKCLLKAQMPGLFPFHWNCSLVHGMAEGRHQTVVQFGYPKFIVSCPSSRLNPSLHTQVGRTMSGCVLVVVCCGLGLCKIMYDIKQTMSVRLRLMISWLYSTSGLSVLVVTSINAWYLPFYSLDSIPRASICEIKNLYKNAAFYQTVKALKLPFNQVKQIRFQKLLETDIFQFNTLRSFSEVCDFRTGILFEL